MAFLYNIYSVPSSCLKCSISLPTIKMVALSLVLVSLLHQGTNQWNGDPAILNYGSDIVNTHLNQSSNDDSCHHLLSNGSFISRDIWKPEGCSMHEYDSVASRQCMKVAAWTTGKKTRIIFLGNSRMRNLFNFLIRQLGATRGPTHNEKDTRPNFIYNNTDLSLEAHYLWRELVNEDVIMDLIVRIKRQPPSLVAIGSILHYFVHYAHTDPRAKSDFKAGITRLAKELDQLPGTFPVLFILPEPIVMKNLKKVHIPIWNHGLIEEYNNVSIKVFESTRVTVVRSIRLIGQLRSFDYPDALHAETATNNIFNQVLLNFFCNRFLSAPPPDTCCGPSARLRSDGNFSRFVTGPPLANRRSTMNRLPSQPGHSVSPPATAITACLCSVFVLMLLGCLLLKKKLRVKTPPGTALAQALTEAAGEADTALKSGHRGWSRPHTGGAVGKHQAELLMEHGTGSKANPVSRRALVSWEDGAACLLKQTLILGYFILCDRLDVFNKGSKQFSIAAFAATLFFALLAATFSRKPLAVSDPGQLTLLRDITDEWKGWMQLVLLVYHFTAASQQLIIYTHIRVLVACYLFLTGYGHFTSFWKSGKAGGFVKYFQTIFRLNFLTVLLCLFMNQPYMNYYFTALVSVWFTAIHVVLALPPWIDGSSPDRTWRDFGSGAFKIVLLTVMVALLSYSEGVFKNIFGTWPLGRLFHLPAEAGVTELRFRWMLDRFSVVYGMVFALLCQAWSRTRVAEASGSVWPASRTGTAVMGLASLSCLSSYAVLLQHCDSKVACNSWHPYLSWIPIVGYILFRHHSAVFRAHFSPLFAWLGRISLELFVSQYHILLANNTRDVLILVPGSRLVNAAVTALVFLCVADEINVITTTLQRTLLPNDARQLARGVAIITLTGLLMAYGNAVLCT